MVHSHILKILEKELIEDFDWKLHKNGSKDDSWANRTPEICGVMFPQVGCTEEENAASSQLHEKLLLKICTKLNLYSVLICIFFQFCFYIFRFLQKWDHILRSSFFDHLVGTAILMGFFGLCILQRGCIIISCTHFIAYKRLQVHCSSFTSQPLHIILLHITNF